jgi:H+/Cl- antiporter ClcA
MQQARDPGSLRSAGSQSDAVVPVTVGTVAWAIALIIVFLLRGRLDANGSGWWVWVCVTGFGLGLFGCWWVRRRRAILSRAKPDPQA